MKLGSQRDADAAIVGIFKTFHTAQPRGRTQANCVTCGRLGLVRTLFSRFVQKQRHDVFKFPLIQGGTRGRSIHLLSVPVLLPN